MTRNLFDRELQRLRREITDMGHKVDVIMQETLQALKKQDIDMAQSILTKMKKSTQQSIVLNKCV